MFTFAAPRPGRRVALTPLIDVVFLLLVFFMLAAQFGRETALDLAGSGGGAGDYSGPPRLVTLAPEGLMLNGQSIAEADLADALAALTESPEDLIVLRPMAGVEVQGLTDLAARLTSAGFTRLVLVE